MLKSQIEFQKNFTYLKPKYYWSCLAVWNISCILVVILLNNQNYFISLLGLVVGFVILVPLAKFSFKASTDKEFQNLIIKPEKLNVFNSNFFFFSGCMLSVFAIVAFVSLVVRVAI